jgi:hypothetical protein
MHASQNHDRREALNQAARRSEFAGSSNRARYAFNLGSICGLRALIVLPLFGRNPAQSAEWNYSYREPDDGNNQQTCHQ